MKSSRVLKLVAVLVVAASFQAIATVRGQIFVAENSSRIEQFTPAGGVGSIFSSDGLLNWPNGMAFDSAGNLYVANGNANTIVKFTGGTPSPFIGANLNNPVGMAFDGSGNLYVANSGNGTIWKFDSTGQSPVQFASGLGFPTYLTFHGGYLYLARVDAYGTENNPQILKFELNGNPSVFTASNLSGPRGLAFDGAGNLYVANSVNNTIYKFDSGATTSTQFASTGLSAPSGIAFDSAGNLLVANFGNHTVYSFPPSGTPTLFTDTGASNLPTNVAVAIPEPATYAALAGLAALGLATWRRRSKHAV
jgi:sugar lactone lactonase YvrE